MSDQRIFIAGDSTASPYGPEVWPRAGWGMFLEAHLRRGWTVENRAVSGRSTKSFLDEGHWTRLVEDLAPGDRVLLQFGHNDQKDQDPTRFSLPWGAYQENLRHMGREAMARGALPVILSSLARRRFEGGLLLATHGDYPAAARRVAEEEGWDFLDVEGSSMELLTILGHEASRLLYLHLPVGKFEGWPEGAIDDTHLSMTGAMAVSFLVADLWRRVSTGKDIVL